MLVGISLNPIDWITDAAGGIIDAASDAFIGVVVGWVEEALSWVTQQIAIVLADLSAPAFGAAALAQLGGTFKWLALVSVVATIVLACGGALLNPKVELSQVVREIPTTMVMLAGWYTAVAIWFEGCRALTAAFTGDALRQAFTTGIALDSGIASFFRLLICLVMIVFLLVFMIEMFVLQHMLTFAAVIGPLAIALRPWPALKDVSARMIRNVATLSLTPALTAASMSLALHTVNGAGVLGISQAIGGLAGMLVSILMPAMVSRFLPLGGSGDSGGRALITAAATTAATVAAIGASTGTAGLAAAGSAGANSQLASFVAGASPPDPSQPGSGGTGPSTGAGAGAGSSVPGIAAQAQAPEPHGASTNRLSFDSDPGVSGPPASHAGGGVAATTVAQRVSEMLSPEEP